MVFVAGKQSSPVLGSPDQDLCLRIVGSDHHGKIVRLAGAKCTIGSADGCTLRLRAAGVRPMHCLILRGSGGTIVRSWAPNTRVNGRAFRDARLVPGDRLSIGPVEFAVLGAEEVAAAASAPPAAPAGESNQPRTPDPVARAAGRLRAR
jgi:hypothetical protein